MFVIHPRNSLPRTLNVLQHQVSIFEYHKSKRIHKSAIPWNAQLLSEEVKESLAVCFGLFLI